MFGRKKQQQQQSLAEDDVSTAAASAPPTAARTSSDDTLTNEHVYSSEPTKQQIKRATRTRYIWTLIAAFFLLISIVFLILVEVGSTNANSDIRNHIYFININLANIIPLSVPNAVLINSIAQTIGLHDFYRVGLWGYCQGYIGEGITSCSKPQTLYWFNPVEIIQSQLFAGATIALPAEINDILGLIRTVSHWMFGLFLTGACMAFVAIFLQVVSIYSRWAALAIMLWTFLTALIITVATVVATVMFIIMKNAITSATQLNIEADIGIQMFAFMWIAAGASIIAFIIQLCLTCCCASRRDVRRGKKRGSKKAWRDSETPGISEKKAPKARQGWFGNKKAEV